MAGDVDAVVVGAGPNGLAAAITLAQAGRRVLVLEARDAPGGACSSAELTLPGYTHDLGSAIHPLAAGSPFLRTLPLAERGLSWAHPPAAVAHPLDGAPAALLERSVAATAAGLGEDGPAYRRLMAPLARRWELLAEALLGPLVPPALWPARRALALAAFGALAVLPARLLAERLFRGAPARALFAGLAAHSVLPLESPASASFGLVTAMLGHAVGWPLPRGGAQRLSDALADHLRALGGRIEVGRRVRDLGELPPAPITMLDLTPRQALAVAGDRLPAGYRAALGRFRYGPGAFKLDWALEAPIPWRDARCLRSATVHVGGTLAEVADAERDVAEGRHPERPFVLLAQPTLFDPSRAPAGRHTAWAYCHVPNGSAEDMADRIEAQVERFAPGFRDRIIARRASAPADLERFDANLVGGDIGGGAIDLRQLLARPTLSLRPYRTALPGLYLCSSSTPPGGGVHGMCGHLAAAAALRDARA